MNNSILLKYKKIDDEWGILEVVENTLNSRITKTSTNSQFRFGGKQPSSYSNVKYPPVITLALPGIIKIPHSSDTIQFLKRLSVTDNSEGVFEDIPYQKEFHYRGTGIYLTKVKDSTLVRVDGETIEEHLTRKSENFELNTNDEHDTKYYVYKGDFTRLNLSTPGAALVTKVSFDTLVELMSDMFDKKSGLAQTFWDYIFNIPEENLF